MRRAVIFVAAAIGCTALLAAAIWYGGSTAKTEVPSKPVPRPGVPLGAAVSGGSGGRK